MHGESKGGSKKDPKTLGPGSWCDYGVIYWQWGNWRKRKKSGRSRHWFLSSSFDMFILQHQSNVQQRWCVGSGERSGSGLWIWELLTYSRWWSFEGLDEASMEGRKEESSQIEYVGPATSSGGGSQNDSDNSTTEGWPVRGETWIDQFSTQNLGRSHNNNQRGEHSGFISPTALRLYQVHWPTSLEVLVCRLRLNVHNTCPE